MGPNLMLKDVKKFLGKFKKVARHGLAILRVMAEVDRAKFIPRKFKKQAYVDEPLPIEKGQMISQPSTVARMLHILQLEKGETVLEIGTGSGWNAALIAEIIKPGKLVTIEVRKELAEKARHRLKEIGIKNARVIVGDFRKLKQKFDKIIFTAGISKDKEEHIANFAIEHLNKGGILICPSQSGPLLILKRKKDYIKRELTREHYAFVPLVNKGAKK